MKRLALMLILVVATVEAFAQTEGARISGRVTDQSGAVIVGTECKITNLETNVSTSTTTNEDGIYVIPDLHPANYRLTIEKEGFRTVVQPSLQLFAQDAVNENFTLALGPRSESITVLGNVAALETDSAAVSTIVDQQFVDNTPLNGRSFQSLIALAPGVVFTSRNEGPGQFSVNGQRSDANYFTVDGVSANFGVLASTNLGPTIAGTTPGLTSGGGTNGLVSVDAMQEFRIQTSSYAPEFGRSPGGQISIVTRSGTNRFHGTAFDYVRNDIFDARNYFDSPPLPKPPLRQNDFGGTLGGPIIKDKTFFFFSYEGLRLRMPQTAQAVFFTASARAEFTPVLQPIVDALPLPVGPLINPACDNITKPCLASLTAAYSDSSVIDATSIRVDQSIGKINLFVRYNHAPSSDATRFWEELTYDNVDTDTLTAGATIPLSPTKVNDFRVNWSRTTGGADTELTDFYGAVVPSTSVLFPPGSPYDPDAGGAIFEFFSPGQYLLEVQQGMESSSVQRQLNFVDTFNWSAGAHQVRFGIDYRRLSPTSGKSFAYFTGQRSESFQALALGNVDNISVEDKDLFSVSINNYSLFAQDTWKATSKLTLTYGLRWEINPAPQSAISGKPLYAVQGVFDSDPLAVTPGTLWHTRFGNVSPRIGAAFQVTPRTVVRGGFGLFDDLGYGSVGDAPAGFPYVRFKSVAAPVVGIPFNLSSPDFQPLPFSLTIDSNSENLLAVDPNLRLPLTLEWNVAIERQLGANQRLTATYVGSNSSRLLREDLIFPPLLVGFGNSQSVTAIRNAGNSDYQALQIQFQRRMAHGLQALVSYNLASAKDMGSSDESGLFAASVAQVVLPPLTPSDFDIRNSIAGAISCEVPAPGRGRIGDAILNGWAVDGLVRVGSAPPINVTTYAVSPVIGYYSTQADVVPGQPYWIADSTQPSGRALNPAAFATPSGGVGGIFPGTGCEAHTQSTKLILPCAGVSK